MSDWHWFRFGVLIVWCPGYASRPHPLFSGSHSSSWSAINKKISRLSSVNLFVDCIDAAQTIYFVSASQAPNSPNHSLSMNQSSVKISKTFLYCKFDFAIRLCDGCVWLKLLWFMNLALTGVNFDSENRTCFFVDMTILWN